MPHVILGTAGHIDHGKTALVLALTGVDTDRLKEEKSRGITIELGFAELASESGPALGVVDVPGHEGFVRTMVAGATGMDAALLVVAADEGVMPQTREHLSILGLLGVPELVVALTKADLVDEEWLELVDEEVGELLAGTPYASSARVAVSVRDGRGLPDLRAALSVAASRAVRDRSNDLMRMPVDRVFTVQGTGTVVTGTLWSGTISVDDRVRLPPGSREGRVRSLQVHGRPVPSAEGGERTAIALAGPGLGRSDLARGGWVVRDAAWKESWMLTVRARLLPGDAWQLAHNQRVRVHLGTAEVMARVALLEGETLLPGGSGWIQLRLESPVAARCRDPLILRSYSPLTTLGGGEVAEPSPRKRRTLNEKGRQHLTALLDADPAGALAALLEDAGWRGVPREELPVLLGLTPTQCTEALEDAAAPHTRVGSRLVGRTITGEARARLLDTLDAEHAADPLRPSIPLSRLRQSLPAWSAARLADVLLDGLKEEGLVESADGGIRRSGFVPTPTEDQEAACRDLEAAYLAAGLAAPDRSDLPAELAEREDLWSLLRRLESQGVLRTISDGVYVHAGLLDAAIERIQREFRGQTDLGPSEFREALSVTRKHLIPLLNYLDGLGVTQRSEGGRSVP